MIQKWEEASKSVDLASLAAQLAILRAELEKLASDDEHDIAIGAVMAAEAEAKEGHGPEALSALAKAGDRVLEVGTKIGVPIAVVAI